MFGATGHLPELIIILILGLVILGPGKLPQVGGAVGKTIREFRKASTEPEGEEAAPDTANAANASAAPAGSGGSAPKSAGQPANTSPAPNPAPPIPAPSAAGVPAVGVPTPNKSEQQPADHR